MELMNRFNQLNVVMNEYHLMTIWSTFKAFSQFTLTHHTSHMVSTAYLLRMSTDSHCYFVFFFGTVRCQHVENSYSEFQLIVDLSSSKEQQIFELIKLPWKILKSGLDFRKLFINLLTFFRIKIFWIHFVRILCAHTSFTVSWVYGKIIVAALFLSSIYCKTQENEVAAQKMCVCLCVNELEMNHNLI